MTEHTKTTEPADVRQVRVQRSKSGEVLGLAIWLGKNVAETLHLDGEVAEVAVEVTADGDILVRLDRGVDQ